MRQLALVGGLIWLVAGAGLPASSWAGVSDPPKHDAHVRRKLATEPPTPTPTRVSEEAARRIAWRSGVDHIEEILLSGELWEVAGRDRTGREKTVDIHAEDGRILD